MTLYIGIAATVDRSGLVRLFDVATPDRPVLLSNFPLPGNLSGVTLAGDSLLVAWQGGVQITSISRIPPLLGCATALKSLLEASIVKSAGNPGYFAYF